MPQIEIRPYVESDRAGLLALFGAAGAGAPGSDIWGHEASLADVYLTPYLDLEPESVFVAVVDGQLAGYLTGCVQSSTFPSEDERLARAIRAHRLYLRPRPLWFFIRARLDLLVSRLRRQPIPVELVDPRWPSHLHIDLLPLGRGVGAADGLMAAWFERLREVGSPGCYLHTSAENHRAVRFFERMGFVKHGSSPVIPGSRHEGARAHQQTMVWTTTPAR
jgi:ribosomal protein S18 acetylase RimI-like enzyme